MAYAVTDKTTVLDSMNELFFKDINPKKFCVPNPDDLTTIANIIDDKAFFSPISLFLMHVKYSVLSSKHTRILFSGNELPYISHYGVSYNNNLSFSTVDRNFVLEIFKEELSLKHKLIALKN